MPFSKDEIYQFLNKNDYFDWHQHVPNIGSGESTFARMRNYQGTGQDGVDKLIELAKESKEEKDEYPKSGYDRLDEKEKEKLTKKVGLLQKDVVKAVSYTHLTLPTKA
mgnify:CR=1 FL=1